MRHFVMNELVYVFALLVIQACKTDQVCILLLSEAHVPLPFTKNICVFLCKNIQSELNNAFNFGFQILRSCIITFDPFGSPFDFFLIY